MKLWTDINICILANTGIDANIFDIPGLQCFNHIMTSGHLLLILL